MTTTRYDLSLFHRLMGYNKSTIIWAPRQSGKSHSMMLKYIETNNSAMMVINNKERTRVKSFLSEMGRTDKTKNVLVMSPHTLRGRQFDTLFVDELECCNYDIGTFLRNVSSSTNKIIAVTTPSSLKKDIYDSLFYNQFVIFNGLVTTIRGVKENYFDKDEDLFVM